MFLPKLRTVEFTWVFLQSTSAFARAATVAAERHPVLLSTRGNRGGVVICSFGFSTQRFVYR